MLTQHLVFLLITFHEARPVFAFLELPKIVVIAFVFPWQHGFSHLVRGVQF